MMVLLTLVATVIAGGICVQRGIASPGDGLNSPLSAGLGAGLGVTWRFALGLGGAPFYVAAVFIVAGILLMFGAFAYGRRIRRLRAELGTNPDNHE